ncbi:MAG: GNAT family N-acetyltransferase [Clostridia bacterium]|nr:GNAT family N-acetyltransferase [Clostridia bacterium]
MKKQKLLEFLKQVDKDFPVPLSKKQDLDKFADKLLEKATILAREENGEILSLVAGYTENIENNSAYISILATLEKARGCGYGKSLIEEFISLCREKETDSVHLYAVKENLPAVMLYRGLGFVEYKMENEPRPMDLHLIYYIKEN